MASLRENLTRIYEQRGQLTPRAVVEEARPEGSELHNRFEWDDSIAGEKYRLAQAAELIRSVRIEYRQPDGTTSEVRAFSTTRGQDPDHAGYRPTEELLQGEFSRQLLLKQCRRDIEDLQRRYGHLVEFAEMLKQAIA